MAVNYHKYSVKRSSIVKQVKRVESKGYVASEKYHLPTVRELKTMPVSQQKQIMKSASGMTTSAVRRTATRVTVSDTGKAKKVSYKEDRKVRRSLASKAGWETRKAKRKKKEPQKDRVERAAKAYEYKRQYGDYPAWYKEDIAEGSALGEVPEPKKVGELTDNEKRLRAEGKDEAFEQAAQYFIDSTPLDQRLNAEAYIEEVREGHDVGSYEEYIANLEEEPTARDTFNMKLENLDQVSPATADYMRQFYQQIEVQVGAEELNRRFENADHIPDFDTPYETKTGGSTVGFGGVAKMLSIIKGRPLSGAEARALGKALEKDQQE